MAASSIYCDLNTSRQEIRLLEIIATDPSIICKTRVVSLLESPTFVALSYQWGNPAMTEEITVNNTTLFVTKSLADALKYVPMHWQEMEKMSEGSIGLLLLWADAICINQQDIEEKNHQVPLMKKIYSSAEYTFCSLMSEKSSLIETAIDTINTLCAGAFKSGFKPDLDHQDAKIDWMLNDLELFGTDPKYALFPKQNDGSEFDEWIVRSGNKARTALQEFMDLQYWERAWIYQELVLSKDLVFFHTSERTFLHVLKFVALWAGFLEMQTRPRKIDSYLWKTIIDLSSFKPLVMIKQSRLLIITKKTVTSQDRDLYLALLRLQDLISTELKATDPKDHVYALQGLTGSNLIPDYSSNTSVADVYIEFCVEGVETLRRSNLPFLYFLRGAGYANKAPEGPELPSWVPNYPGCSTNGNAYQPSYLVSSTEKRNMHRSNFNNRANDISICKQSLFAPALVIASLDDTSDVLGEAKSAPEFASSVVEVINYRRVFGDRHPLLKLASALWGKNIEEEVWESPEVFRVIRFLQTTLPHSEVTFSFDFLDRIHLGWIWLVKLTGFDRDLVSTILDSLAVEDPKTIPKLEHPYPSVIQFLRRLLDHETGDYWHGLSSTAGDLYTLTKSGGMRVARTASETYSEFSIVPAAALKGDVIVFLAGSEKLHLVRRVEDHYVYIGEAGDIEALVTPMLNKVSAGEEDFQVIEIR
ncbi:uncharacterized protein EAE98_008042 [Botrytis deweyae]|uniref:Heterokaryon incompatibility domain-containing protein n=1 Tax=Botrytis deweyae TaxID=2478750 RepID=A0ABQ7IFG3_9HELO|nr:uncharacterized protein EAE98_008042 [Botrytis deweyae]KAF7922516.1 hypothetical protein EAE98_008042 [Botrytis deweyae]